ncbi:MAG: transketolase [Bdellovibrionales bacterium]|nr:transketolase [Bdellovibrionales bacterium]
MSNLSNNSGVKVESNNSGVKVENKKISEIAFPLKSELAENAIPSPKYFQILKRPTEGDLKVVDPKATRALVALMDMQAQLAGAASHWGGPSAFAELMSVAHGLIFDKAQKLKQKWFEMFHFVNDAGHCENGLYALKAIYGYADVTVSDLKQFRSIKSPLTGHGEAHLFKKGVFISNGPLGSGLPQAQGLAIADGFLGRFDRLTICAISDGGCMEGEAREALAAIPGLAKKGKTAPFLLIISDNNTKLSGRIDQDSYSMTPTFAALKELGWNVLELNDAHNLNKVLATMEQAFTLSLQNPQQPVAIWAKTIKGFGNKKTELSASGGHGFPLKDPQELGGFLNEIYGDAPVPVEFLNWSEELKTNYALAKKTTHPSKEELKNPLSYLHHEREKIQTGVSKALIKARQEGLPIVSISADLQGSTGLADFHKKFPDSCLDVGVAESNMVSVSIGLSKSGFIPVVDTFAQFGITKGNLPLIMASLSEGPVIGVFSHSGFQDAADGASHQALSYFSALSSIPHLDIYSLSCSSEAESLVEQAVNYFAQERKSGRVPRSKIFFLGRENFPRKFHPHFIKSDDSYYSDKSLYQLGKAQVLWDNIKSTETSITLIASGSLVEETLLAAQWLQSKSLGCLVIHPSQINNPDLETLSAALKKTGGNLLTVEDHQLTGGMGSLITHALLRAGVKINQYFGLGVQGVFGQSAYQAKDLYEKHGLDAQSIGNAALKGLKYK